MSKINRLEQLENENSLYRVRGVFDKSEICHIIRIDEDTYAIVGALIPVWYDTVELSMEALHKGISNGSITIMCLQRGKDLPVE
jgi:hypothetical protein